MGQAKIGDMAIAVGTVFRDAELKHVGDKGTALCEFGVVVGKKPDGSGRIFANCKAWRELGEYASQIRDRKSVV